MPKGKKIGGKTLTEWILFYAKRRKNPTQIAQILNKKGFKTTPSSTSTIIAKIRREGEDIPKLKRNIPKSRKSLGIGPRRKVFIQEILENPGATHKEILELLGEAPTDSNYYLVTNVRKELEKKKLVPPYIPEKERRSRKLTPEQQELYDSNLRTIKARLDYAKSNMPRSLRRTFHRKATLDVISALKNYDPAKGDIRSYIIITVFNSSHTFFRKQLSIVSGLPTQRVEVALASDKIAREQTGNNFNKDQLENAAEIALSQRGHRSAFNSLMPSDVVNDVLKIRRAIGSKNIRMRSGNPQRGKLRAHRK